MRIFILEDDKNRIETFRRKLAAHDLVVVETAQDAISKLGDDQAFDAMFLDHDLGGEQMVGTEGANTGSEVVRWMVPNQTVSCPVIIHSLNQPAALSMKDKLEGVGMTCFRIPFTQLVSIMDNPDFLRWENV